MISSAVGKLFQLGVDVIQALEVGGLGLAHRVIGAAAFQQGHHRKDLVQVLFGQLGHEATPAGFQDHQALAVQHLEGFPERGAADAERFGQGLFVDPLPRLQVVAVDPVAETLGDLLVED